MAFCFQKGMPFVTEIVNLNTDYMCINSQFQSQMACLFEKQKAIVHQVEH